jgi:hypothetical protein
MTTVWITWIPTTMPAIPIISRVFATPDAADKEHDPEGVVFGYEVIGVDVERTGSGERSLPCC